MDREKTPEDVTDAIYSKSRGIEILPEERQRIDEYISSKSKEWNVPESIAREALYKAYENQDQIGDNFRGVNFSFEQALKFDLDHYDGQPRAYQSILKDFTHKELFVMGYSAGYVFPDESDRLQIIASNYNLSLRTAWGDEHDSVSRIYKSRTKKEVPDYALRCYLFRCYSQGNVEIILVPIESVHQEDENNKSLVVGGRGGPGMVYNGDRLSPEVEKSWLNEDSIKEAEARYEQTLEQKLSIVHFSKEIAEEMVFNSQFSFKNNLKRDLRDKGIEDTEAIRNYIREGLLHKAKVKE